MKALTNYKECPKCGGGHKSKPFCIYENGYYCFSCGYSKASDRSYNSTVKHKICNDIKVPNYVTNINCFSLEAQEWLLKYSVTQNYIDKYKIGYTEDNCLLFLNIKNDEIIGYQKRNMLNRHITTSGQKTPMLLFKESNKKIIIVEDFISAIRLNKFYNALCLWGTKISYQSLLEVFKGFDKVLVWLDNDNKKQTNSGQEAAKVIVKMASSIINEEKQRRGFSISPKCINNIITAFDPKCYLDSELVNIIKEAEYVDTK